MSEYEGHTPGPWYVDNDGRIWRRPPSDLYENGGGVAGDKPIAAADIGWYGDDVESYPLTANARLIADAPKLLAERDRLFEVLKEVQECSAYWSEYYVPIGIHDRIQAAIASVESLQGDRDE